MRIVTVVLFASLAATLGCATPDADPRDRPLADPPPPPPSSSKADEVVPCGLDTCVPALCGAHYAPESGAWMRSCATADETAQAYVAATITGAVEAELDSVANGYQPVVSNGNEIEDAVFYGCTMLLELPGSDLGAFFKLALEEYAELSWQEGTARTGRMLELRPHYQRAGGEWAAHVTFIAGPDGPAFGTVEQGLGACTLRLDETPSGGYRGAFTCSAPGDAGAVVEITGSYHCPRNTLGRGVWNRL